MYLLIEALNNPSEAFKRHNSKISWVFVILTILVVTVFDPIISYLANGSDYDVSIDVVKILLLSVLGGVTYLTICLILWIVCKIFGSKTPLTSYFRSWGVSYIPTLICAVFVALSETFFYLFWNNSVLGMILSIVFIGILIWKCILYIIFLREVAQLKGKRIVGALIVCGLCILMLAFINMFIGLKTPIL